MTTFPVHPFTYAQLGELDISKYALRIALRSGGVRRILRGVYCSASVDLTPEILADAIARVLPPDVALVDWTAAQLHGLDCGDPRDRDLPALIDVTSLRGVPKRRPQLRYGQRSLPEAHVTNRWGICVTTPARTACDLACRAGRGRALGVLDQFLRRGGVTREELERMLPAFRGRRGVTQLRELIQYADPRSESMGESMTRMLILDEGLPPIDPQLELWVPRWGYVLIYLAYRAWKIAVEYDGEEFHSDPADVERDRRRREALRREGWLIIVVTKEMLSFEGSRAWLRELAEAIADRRTPRRIAYARGLRLGSGRRPA